MTLENLQRMLFEETELEKSTSSQAVSRAKTCRSQENLPASTKERAVDYGPKSSDLLASYDPSTSSWRTSQTCLVALLTNEADGLAVYSETWPSAGMMRNGKTYRRQPWALPIAENASGLLPTPKTSDAKGAPRSRYLGSETYRQNLCEALRTGPECGIYPHPELLNQMMGYPAGWTELEPAEMP